VSGAATLVFQGSLVACRRRLRLDPRRQVPALLRVVPALLRVAVLRAVARDRVGVAAIASRQCAAR
jgi:hypothetical protein